MTAAIAVAGIELAELGWPVFPIKPREKTPITRNGFKDATTDHAKIQRWFHRYPEANLAVATGAPGPDVLDIDNPADPAAKQALALIRQTHAPQVATPRGTHSYFQGTTQTTVDLGFGELRRHGSYVLVPPSIHPSGKIYVWTESPTSALPPAPDTLAGHRTPAGTGDFDQPDLIAHGSRHDALKDFAIRLLRGGVTDPFTLEQMLASFFATRCDPNPPPRKDEFKKIAQWAANTDIAGREREAATAEPLLKPAKKTKQGKLDKPPAGDAPLAEHRAYVRLAGGWSDRIDIETVVRYGGRGINRLKIELSNGQQVIFDRQELVATRGQWARTVVMHTNGIANPANVNDWQALQVLRSLCVLADAPPEIRENEDIDDHVNELEAMAEPIDDHDPGDPEGRYRAAAHCHAHGTWEPRSNNDPERPVLIVDNTTGRRYLRAGELLTYLNWRGFNIAPSDLEARMRAIGLVRHAWFGREGRRLDGKRRRTNRMVVYELPAETE